MRLDALSRTILFTGLAVLLLVGSTGAQTPTESSEPDRSWERESEERGGVQGEADGGGPMLGGIIIGILFIAIITLFFAGYLRAKR